MSDIEKETPRSRSQSELAAALSTHVVVQLKDSTGAAQKLEFDIVPDKQSDFSAGLMSERSGSEIVEMHHIRAVLEGLAARLAVANLTSNDYANMNAILDQITVNSTEHDPVEVLNAFRSFHEVIWRAAHAPRLYNLLENLYVASQRVRNPDLLLPKRLERLVQDHRSLIEAIACGDAAQAERLAHEHNERTERDLIAALQGKMNLNAK